MNGQPRLATLRQAGELRPMPNLSADASRRRWGHLVRTGAVPAGVSVRLGGRVFLDLVKLDAWLASGGSLSRAAAPEPERGEVVQP